MGRRRARGGQGSREEQEEGIGPGVALIGGVSAPATGLHTGIVYQGAGEASGVGNYSEVLRAALADQLMLAHTDLVVAVCNGAVTSLSAFARAAGTRAARATRSSTSSCTTTTTPTRASRAHGRVPGGFRLAPVNTYVRG